MANMRTKKGTYIRSLSNFGGLDLTGIPGDATPRFSRLDNMWRDYHAGEGEIVESFPGYRALTTLSGAVHGIWLWQNTAGTQLVIHAGHNLYCTPFAGTDSTTLPATPALVTGGNATLADTRSEALSFGDSLYILDGTHYFALTYTDGTASLGEVKNLYIPITYSDGVAYEQQNLLSEYVFNRYRIGDPAAYTYGSYGLKYNILSTEEGTCEVAGYATPTTEAVLYIPAHTVIGGKNYRVTRIAWKAFTQKSHLREVYISEGVEEVGIGAFGFCSALERVYLPDSILCIRRSAFMNCKNLSYLFFGRNLQQIEADILLNTPLTTLAYHGDSIGYDAIVKHEYNADLPASSEVTYVSDYPVQVARFPFFEPITHIESITLDGVDVPQTAGAPHYVVDYMDDGKIGGVVLHTDHTYNLTGKELMVRLRLDPLSRGTVSGETDFAAASLGYDGLTYAAMAQCTRMAIYDGRVFFTGNPALPTTVFYTARDLTGKQNPAYVGIYNYFMCGDEGATVTALLPTASYLAVFSGRDDRGRVSYYHGKDTENDFIPRIYLTTDSIVVGSVSHAVANLRDDPLFLTNTGVEAAGKEALNSERAIRHRSTLIDAALIPRDPKDAMCTVWEGYFVLLYPDGEAYLADSRRTCSTLRGTEYEWYHLTGVTAYDNDIPVFRYADVFDNPAGDNIAPDGIPHPLALHPCPGTLPLGCDLETYPEVYPALSATTTTDGNPVTYVKETTDGAEHLYRLAPTGERTGGTVSPPTTLATCRDKLLIGFANGTVAVVNTDRRGRNSEVLPTDAPPPANARTIHPAWYTFLSHRYPMCLATMSDDCGVPNYTKSTLRGTTVLEMKAGAGLGVTAEIRLERCGTADISDPLTVSHDSVDFIGFHFGGVDFGMCDNTTLPIVERSRRYMRKQYIFSATAFARPFGLRRLSYTWQTEGKVKPT